VKAKILSVIFLRHIGHSEQASEQDLHKQKCRHGSRIAAVGDSKHTLQTWELASPFPRYLSSFSFISCMRALRRTTNGSSLGISSSGFGASKSCSLGTILLSMSLIFVPFNCCAPSFFLSMFDSGTASPSFFNLATRIHIFARSFSKASSLFLASSAFFLHCSSTNSFSANAASRAASLCFLACSSIFKSSASRLHDSKSSTTAPEISLARLEILPFLPDLASPNLRLIPLTVCTTAPRELTRSRVAINSFSNFAFCNESFVTSPARFFSSTAAAEASSLA
ncbi:hypothetical protein V8G54_006959, partial [Vigna mungo]